MKKPSIDIKSLTAELKSISQNPPKSNVIKESDDAVQNKNLYSDRSGNPQAENGIEDEPLKGQTTDNLIQIIKKVNSKNHYTVDRFIYVDNDIHEVLVKLKAQTKLKISYLASSLLEEFITKHKPAILELLSKKQNKFLD